MIRRAIMRVVTHRYFIPTAFIAGVTALAAGIFFAYSLIKNLPSPERITERSVIQSTKIYDRESKVLLYEIHGEEKRTVVPLHDIPQTAISATLAAEDINFYHHHGLDWRGIARALFKNITSGDITQGGSTITQQLVKNSILTGERTFTRKIKEALLALLIETKYSKDDILELYLNQIPYGSNAYGIAAAAETFFGKQIQDVTLEEAAILVSLPKAPSYYSPYGSHTKELMDRKNWVLSRMAQEHLITPQDAERAQIAPLSFLPPHRGIQAPHFVMYIKEYLTSKYGETFVEQGGLKVITTLDWKLQQAAEKAITEGAERNEKLVGVKNAALVALDPKTGEILAMVGSRDYFDTKNDGNVNVTIRPRQPGSAFKPFVYATAFKKGFTPETVLFDVQTEFNPLCNANGTPGPLVKDPNTCYHPQDYDGKFRGPVSLRQSLAQSLNIPSVKLLYLAGIDDSIKTAQSLGITTLTDPSRYGLSLVLGGAEVTLLEMTSAFGAFAQDGVLHPKTAILRVEDADGTVLEEKKDQGVPALDTEVARTVNDVLSDNASRVPVFSPTSSLYFPDRQVAAKTGTTQDYRDAWTIGYTPSIAAGVWVGNNDNTPMDQKGLSVMVAGPMWHAFMSAAFESLPPERFIPPEKEIPEKPVFRGLWRSGPIIKIDSISGKLASESTPEDLIKEVSLGNAATILTQVDKNDPAGPPPQNPSQDPQFANWQAGISSWLLKNFLPIQTAPTEVDTTHTPDKKPHILFLYPSEQAPTVPSLPFVTMRMSSAFPLQEVSLFIDGELAGSQTAPFAAPILSFPLIEKSAPGIHRITSTAYDAVGNKESHDLTVTIVP